MTASTEGTQPSASTDGHLVIEPRFTGRSYMAVLRVMVAGESVLVHKVDLAKDGARQAFVEMVTAKLPAVDASEVHAKMLRLCDSRAASLTTADEAAAEGGQEPTLADLMVQIANDEAELFHDKAQNAFAMIEVEDHVETWAVKSKGFRLWLRRRLREEHDRSASAEAVNAALEEIESKALFDGPKVEVFVRLAEHAGDVWLDLCNEKWQAVRVTPTGWQIVSGKLPVRFIRARGMLPLVPPERGGSIEDLRRFLNVHEESEFVLLVAWLLACLRQRGPFPVLSVNGEQGSAKSTLQKLLRALVDPNSAPLRCEPREPRDLVISAANSWIIGFDNLSSIRPWLSDALCRLSTGGGYAIRELYTDAAEVIFESQRPVMFNGITDVANRSDLLDRSLLITLAAIPEDERRPEKQLWAEFEKVKPKILGVLLDAVAAGLAGEPAVKLARLPRMADFAVWITACEQALGWATGTFMAAYTENRSSANETAMEASIVGTVVVEFMADRPAWEGTSADLLAALEAKAGEKVQRRQDWPKSPRKLSGDLRRVAPNLRRAGLDIRFERGTGKDRKRMVRLGKADGGTATAGGSGEHRPAFNLLLGPALGQGADGSDGCVRRIENLDDDERFAWDERVAVCMNEGGLPQAEAENVAWREVESRRQAATAKGADGE